LQLGPQVGPAAGTPCRENLTYGLSSRCRLHLYSIFSPWQELQTDAKPTGQFRIAPVSCDARVNKICQKYKRRRFQTVLGSQQLRFTQTKLGMAASHAICTGMVHGQQLCPCSAAKCLLAAPTCAHSLGRLPAAWHRETQMLGKCCLLALVVLACSVERSLVAST